jgi:pimeloyl-ACP methyl ester carboxylesterase
VGSAERARRELDRLEELVQRVEVRVDAGGEVIVARCAGRGPAVVLLHGGSGSWTHWVRTIPALAGHFRVIAIDLPGFGDSSLPGTVRSAHDLARRTSQAIRHLVPRGTYGLVGFSFGGIVAGLVAAHRRARVNRLVLIAAGGLGLGGTVKGTLLPVPADGSEEDCRAAHRHNLSVLMIADPAKVDDLAVAVHAENVAKARFRTGDIPASSTLADALPAVRAPITYLAGDRDAFAGRREGEKKRQTEGEKADGETARGEKAEGETAEGQNAGGEKAKGEEVEGEEGGEDPSAGDSADLRLRILRTLRPDCEVVPVPGAGHWAMYEQPELVNALLIERLSLPG